MHIMCFDQIHFYILSLQLLPYPPRHYYLQVVWFYVLFCFHLFSLKQKEIKIIQSLVVRYIDRTLEELGKEKIIKIFCMKYFLHGRKFLSPQVPAHISSAIHLPPFLVVGYNSSAFCLNQLVYSGNFRKIKWDCISSFLPAF